VVGKDPATKACRRVSEQTCTWQRMLAQRAGTTSPAANTTHAYVAVALQIPSLVIWKVSMRPADALAFQSHASKYHEAATHASVAAALLTLSKDLSVVLRRVSPGSRWRSLLTLTHWRSNHMQLPRSSTTCICGSSTVLAVKRSANRLELASPGHR
jgi:hypothetical protein